MTDAKNRMNSGHVPGYLKGAKKTLIPGSILVVLITGLLFIPHSDVRQKEDGFELSGLYLPDSAGADERRHYEKQNSLISDFEGLQIDTFPMPDDVIEIITHELKSLNWNESFKEEDINSLYHTTVFATHFPSARSHDRKLIVVTFSNHTGNYFHAASGKISLFEFQDDANRRTITRRYLAFGSGNEYGLEPLGCELVQIGSKKKYALIVHTSYSGQGHEKETKTVFAEINNKFESVFEFTNYEYYNYYPVDIEYTEGNTYIRIIRSNKIWFDIETGNEVTEWTDKTPGLVMHFIFNGKEYVESNRIFLNTS